MTARHWRRWTEREDERLRFLWGTRTLVTCAAKIGRTEVAVYARARALGLTSGAPQGMEYLHHAARRTGMSTAALAGALRANGVHMHRAMARPASRREDRRRHYQVVDSGDVDEVVATWCRQETPEGAAARHGVCGDTVRRLLVAAGHAPPRRKREWRIDPAVVDAVVEAWRAERARAASVCAHARRLGIHRTALARRLREAGVLGAKRPGVEARLLVDVVDRAMGRAA